MWNLAGKIAVVTGAARGIGRGISENLAGNGCTVVVADIRGEAAERCAAEIHAEGYRAAALTLDVTDGEAVRIAFASVEERYGRIDVLVNNAGILHDAPITEIAEERWNAVIDTNLKGTFLCARAVVPGMVRRSWGRIINVSSIGGKDGFSLAGVHYAASKAGILGFTRQLAKQVAANGITVNAVAPVTTESEMIAHRDPVRVAWITEQIPLGRLGRPEDTAEAVAFLAGEESGFITGETIDVCGGLYR